MAKYNNQKTVIDGLMFDSRAEAARYVDLREEERAGRITELKMQVPFWLYSKRKDETGSWPAMKYVADFTYFDTDGKYIVEDVKGVITPVFKLKKRLMLEIHGIVVKEVHASGRGYRP